MNCWIVLVHDRLAKNLRCPKCGRKLIWLRDDITVAGMNTLLGGAILIWGTS